jgi:hypothetical protein
VESRVVTQLRMLLQVHLGPSTVTEILSGPAEHLNHRFQGGELTACGRTRLGVEHQIILKNREFGGFNPFVLNKALDSVNNFNRWEKFTHILDGSQINL